MSLNKIIIAFVIILIAFAAFFFLQFNRPSAPKETVTIQNQTFYIEVATTSAQLEKGLSDRKSLPQDQGMLFVFDKPGEYPFWMKDVQFPLDIIFLRDNKIISITKNATPPTSKQDTLPIYRPPQSIDAVLEINGGLSDKYKFKPGDTLTSENK